MLQLLRDVQVLRQIHAHSHEHQHDLTHEDRQMLIMPAAISCVQWEVCDGLPSRVLRADFNQ